MGTGSHETEPIVASLDRTEASDSHDAPAETQKKKGLSWWLTAIFIAGEMAGSGILALPHAIRDAGWSGVAVLFVCGLNALYSGICLGRCWIILEERWPEYRGGSRHPYPSIASRAVAPWMRYVVSVCVDFTLFGVATVFLLLSSQTIGSLAASWDISFCSWILILAAILTPLMWLGTPDDFWPAAVIALSTTALASLLLVVAMVIDAAEVPLDVPRPNPTVESFFFAFATILFAFGGAATFPTFQNDMKDRSQFPKSASAAFAVLILMYAPVAIIGYKVYGGNVQQNIVSCLLPPPNGLTIAIQVCLAVHLFFAFLLAINAPAQEFEEILNIPNKFGWKRCVLRTCMMLVVAFVGLSIPRFGKILDLVGGSTVTMMTFVFPPLFYMKLCSQSSPAWSDRSLPLYQRIYLIEIMVIGIVGGCISTVASVKNIVSSDTFSPPCYIDPVAASRQ